MGKQKFFTPEMGQRLREIRLKAGLSQDDVAERMGLVGKGRRIEIWRLERAQSVSPSLEKIARYLRACGAMWYQFDDLLNKLEPVPIPTHAIEQTEFKPEIKARIVRATRTQVDEFQKKLAYPLRPTKPEAPAKQAGSVAGFRNYRTAINIIEQAVNQILAPTKTSVMGYVWYKALARDFLGILWHRAQKPEGRAELQQAMPKLPQSLIERFEKRVKKWENYQLDSEIIGKIQAEVVSRFFRFLAEEPQML